jgi:elongation factor Ts
MTISAKDVNALRQQTGAGMMDCKKALTEAEGDYEKAIDILRKKGQKVSAARQDKEAAEGAVFAQLSADGRRGILFQLSSETDFVARNEDFQALGKKIAEAAAKEFPADLEALKALTIDGRSVAEHITEIVGKIAEKIDITAYERLEGQGVAAYIHPGARIGVLIAFDGTDGVDVASVGKDVAMQIAAMNPVSIGPEDVPAEIVARELEIGKEQARAEGKPEEMLEKIAQGKLNKFYKEATLLEQEFVKDSTKTIRKFLYEQSAHLKVLAFRRMRIGS